MSLPRVALVIRVPGAALLPPPEGESLWVKKLWSALKPQGSLGCWRAVLQGTLAEVSSHLWRRQTLWLSKDGENLEVHFAELVDPSADFSTGRYERELQLEENACLGTGQGSTLNVSLELTDAGEEPSSFSEAFLLTMQVTEGAVERSEISLRIDNVEYSLCRQSEPSVSHWLPLTETWEDVREALSELEVCWTEMSDLEICEIPIDLSPLAAEGVAELGSHGLAFNARVQRLTEAPEALPELDIWEQGARLLAVGSRHWRLSVEVRWLRLSERGANAFIVYNYPPLKQSRSWRSKPTLLRKKARAELPNTFAAYSLTSSYEELEAHLQEPLYLEVWHRDLYRKDCVLGISAAELGSLPKQRVQDSTLSKRLDSRSPDAVGFRALDQVCPIIDSDEEKQVGSMRVIVFLEDLGQAMGVGLPAKAPAVGPAVVAAKPHQEALLSKEAPLKGAYELEMWRQGEEEKFRCFLQEQEQNMKDQLEEEYRQKEESRAAEFSQRKAKLCELESTVRRKLQELHEQELAVGAEETRVATLQAELSRRMGVAVAEHEDLSKRQASEAEHGLELARQKTEFLEKQQKQLEAELSAQSAQLLALRPLQSQVSDAPAELKEELHSARLQLREQQLRAEGIAAGRDHFKKKVEELCWRQDRRRGEAQGQSGIQGMPMQNLSPGLPGPDLAAALRQVQQDLAQLAETWETPKRSKGPSPCVSAQKERRQDAAHQERHLAWLRGQRLELLKSGLYSRGDAVLVALETRIAEAEASLSET